MKQSYISVDKRSKKAQKEYYAAMRQTWNGLNPVTRTVPNGKAYNRKKAKYKVCREHQFGIQGVFMGHLMR